MSQEILKIWKNLELGSDIPKSSKNYGHPSYPSKSNLIALLTTMISRGVVADFQYVGGWIPSSSDTWGKEWSANYRTAGKLFGSRPFSSVVFPLKNDEELITAKLYFERFVAWDLKTAKRVT